MIPLFDVKAQAQAVESQLEVAIVRALGNERLMRRLDAGAFEERFAEYCNVGCCCAVSSGASALHLALLAAGVGPGDEVITVSMNFAATTTAIIRCGATPVFVDVDPVTWTMDPALIEAAITKQTRAIVPTHLHGLMADMDPIMSIARRHDLLVVEDAAQAHGAEYKGRRAGFSFYPDKNLGAYSEAGAVVTNHHGLARRVLLVLDRLKSERSNRVLAGYDERMDNVQAAVLNVKMDYVEPWIEARRAIAAEYDRQLLGLELERPRPPSHSRPVYYVYAVRLSHRDEARERLRGAGIGGGIHYAVPVHLHKSYVELGYRVGDLPVSEGLGREFLSHPIYPELPPDRVSFIASELKNIAAPEARMFRRDGAFQNNTRPD